MRSAPSFTTRRPASRRSPARARSRSSSPTRTRRARGRVRSSPACRPASTRVVARAMAVDPDDRYPQRGRALGGVATARDRRRRAAHDPNVPSAGRASPPRRPVSRATASAAAVVARRGPIAAVVLALILDRLRWRRPGGELPGGGDERARSAESRSCRRSTSAPARAASPSATSASGSPRRRRRGRRHRPGDQGGRADPRSTSRVRGRRLRLDLGGEPVRRRALPARSRSGPRPAGDPARPGRGACRRRGRRQPGLGRRAQRRDARPDRPRRPAGAARAGPRSALPRERSPPAPATSGSPTATTPPCSRVDAADARRTSSPIAVDELPTDIAYGEGGSG